MAKASRSLVSVDIFALRSGKWVKDQQIQAVSRNSVARAYAADIAKGAQIKFRLAK